MVISVQIDPKIHVGYFAIMNGPNFQPVTVIRDQLYDRIEISRPELALINTEAFQRLERIQQLGFASRIWPGARHTRFEHSLGVLHLARLAVTQLRRQSGTRDRSPHGDRAFIAAALLHDIGHYPYSHAIEELGDPVQPHELIGRRVITEGPVAEILRDQWEVDPALVAGFIDPEAAQAENDPVLIALLSGPLDIDKLDYLPRDARACGVPYGGVDTARLIEALSSEVIDGAERLVIQEKGISPAHSLINARQEMFDNVYWHHTNRACMVMLLRAVQEGILGGQIDPDQLATVDDFTMLQLLDNAAMPNISRNLCQSLRRRVLHKRAIELSSRGGAMYDQVGELFHDARRRRGVERSMSAAITGDPEDGAILIDIPKPEKWRTNVTVVFARPPVGFDRHMSWQDVAGMTDADLKRYETHRRLIRIVVRADLREQVRQSWEPVLESALAAPMIS